MRKSTKAKRKKTSGFTLIELLVVVAIVGILAAIAIPQFAAYRARGFNARVEADARNAATAEEAYFVDNDSYAAGDCTDLPGFTLSDGVTCTTELKTCTGGGDGFTISSEHGQATKTCAWDSCPDSGPNLTCTDAGS